MIEQGEIGNPSSFNRSLDGTERYVYRHILAADFDARQWRHHATGRFGHPPR